MVPPQVNKKYAEYEVLWLVTTTDIKVPGSNPKLKIISDSRVIVCGFSIKMLSNKIIVNIALNIMTAASP